MGLFNGNFGRSSGSGSAAGSLVIATGGRNTGEQVNSSASVASPTWIRFNDLQILNGTGASINGTTGEITLPAGTYHVSGTLGAPSSGGRTQFAWFVNGTIQGAVNSGGGSIGGSFSPSDTGGNQEIAGPATATFVLAATGVLRMGAIRSTATIQFGGGTDTPEAYPRFEIHQLR